MFPDDRQSGSRAGAIARDDGGGFDIASYADALEAVEANLAEGGARDVFIFNDPVSGSGSDIDEVFNVNPDEDVLMFDNLPRQMTRSTNSRACPS